MQHLLVVGNSCIDFVNLRAPLLKSIVETGCKVTVVGPQVSDSLVTNKMKEMHLNFIPYKIKPVSINFLYDLITFFSLLKIYKRVKPDKVLLLTLKPIVYGSFAAKFFSLKEVFSLNSGLGRIFVRETIYQKFVFIFLYPLLKLALKFNQNVFFQNPDDLALFEDLGICPSSKSIVVNGTGVDLTQFKFTEKKPSKTLNFLLIARLIKEKGVFFYYESARKLKQKYPNVNFLLLGNLCNGHSAISKEEIMAWKKEKVIDYLGETDDVRPFLDNADVFVLPTYYREGVPRTCMEAMAKGLPIITTDVPGCRETVINSKNGVLIEPKNQEALTRAMEDFILKPEMILDMARFGRKLVEQKFDINGVNKNIREGMGIHD